MRRFGFRLITLTLGAFFLAQSPIAYAQFPVTDMNSIVQAVQANTNYLQQLKQVQAAAGSSEGIGAAIGKATSSFSEFTGQLQEQKAKLEAKKAKYEQRMAKLKKRKAQLEAAKKKVEEAKAKAEIYKNQYDSYKNSVNNAVNTVKSAGNVIDAVKSGDFSQAADALDQTYSGVKNSAQDIANQAGTIDDTAKGLSSDIKSTGTGFAQEMKNVSQEANQAIEETKENYQQKKEDYQNIKQENKSFRKRPNLSQAPMPQASHAVYASATTMAFGQVSVYTGTTETNVFIFPDALASFCEINAEDVKEEGVMSSCLNKLLELKNSEDMALKQKAVDICRLAYQQFVVAGIEEAVIAKQNLYNFEKDTLPSLMEKSKSANDERLLFGALSAIDTENVNLLHTTATNYTTQSMLSAFKDFCDLEIQKENEIDN